MAITVKVRSEKLNDGRRSLFLDIYNNGKQKQPRLGLYLVPERTDLDKQKNNEILRIAEIKKNEVEMQLLHNKYGTEDIGAKYQDDFIVYVDYMVKQREKTGVNYDTWLSMFKHLKKFTNGSLHFRELNENWLEDFKAYLIKGVKLSQNSAHTYFNKVKRAVHNAHRDKIIGTDYAYFVKSPKMVNTRREFLTKEELQRLIEAECRYPVIKKAFIFSCLTGLRWSDAVQLYWRDIQFVEGKGYTIQFTQKKTKQYEYLPISETAVKLLGEREEDNSKVFIGLKYSAWHNVGISQWVMNAEIKKKITFHCARHTFATLLLNNGTDIFTVSKLLGHNEIKTTQIYAKLQDENKREAINGLVDLIF